MTDERRFSETEIARILEQAIATQDIEKDLEQQSTTAAPARDVATGLTLGQLQEIGNEVGIAPEFMARAAAAVARGELEPTRQHRWMGLPIGVSRTIEFDRTISDPEWERIVVMLRETFSARGRMAAEGSFRQWSNGNLQALLEPTERGHRLRLSTRKGDAKGLVGLGIAMLGAAAGSLAISVVGGQGGAEMFAMSGTFGMVGLAALLPASLRLPFWARTRASQMEAIASRAGQIATAPTERLPA
ncbi:MAG: hypothetical protein V4617_09940 [Gemmatimonadota bacterium]